MTSLPSDVYTCVLNAAEGQLDIIVSKGADGQMLSAHSLHAPTRGAEMLTPALQSVCELYGLSPQDINRFACVHGPGSFTGLRLVMSTVAAIRRITGAANAGIDYMQALALTLMLTLQKLPTSEEQKTIHACVLTHARRNLVHAQFFSFTFPKNIDALKLEDLPTAMGEVLLISPAELVESLSNKQTPLFMLGTGLVSNRAYLQESCAKLPISFVDIQRPSLEALNLLAQHATYHHDDLQPLYIRPCDAVENLTHIAEKQGMDGEKAHARLRELLQKGL